MEKFFGIVEHPNFKEISDDILILLIKEGNRLAFHQIYFRYWKKLYGYTFNILNDHDLTEDVLQEVFVAIWLKKEKLTIRNLKAYLFSATRNKAISLIRQAHFTSLQEEIIEKLTLISSPEQHLHLEDLKNTIDKAATQLPERCREIFYLSRFDHLSNAEIAERLGISHRAVENQLSIALKHLRPAVRNSLYLVLFIILG